MAKDTRPDVLSIEVPVDQHGSSFGGRELELVHNEHWDSMSLRAQAPQYECEGDGGNVELFLDSDGLDKLIAGAMAMKERLDKRAAKTKGESPEVQG